MISRPLKLGEPLIKLETVDSTNDYATNLLRTENAGEGTVILADYQSLGKGRGNNRWQSEKGQNLLFSIIFKPDFLRADKQFYLSMGISNGIAELVEKIAGNSKIKWPNDIFLNNKKVAGILIENTIMKDKLYTSVAGIGLNVNQQIFSPDLTDAISLYQVTGKKYDLFDVLNDLLRLITKTLEPLYSGDYGTLKIAYLNRLFRLNEWTRLADSSGMFEGRIVDIGESGELLVEKHKGQITPYSFGEIKFG